MSEIVVRGPYDPVIHPGVSFQDEVSMTEQSHLKACDINNIMKRYEKTGLLDHVNTYGGNYGDFTFAEDYHTSLNKILAADEMFMSIPAEIRAKFANDPAEFLNFVHDPSNAEELVKLGLANPGGADATDPSPSPGVGDGGTGTGSTPSEATGGSASENAGGAGD